MPGTVLTTRPHAALWALGHRAHLAGPLLLAALVVFHAWGSVRVPVPVLAGGPLPSMTVNGLAALAYPIAFGLFFTGTLTELEWHAPRPQLARRLLLVAALWVGPLALGIVDPLPARNCALLLLVFCPILLVRDSTTAITITAGWTIGQSVIFGLSHAWWWKLATCLLRATDPPASWALIGAGLLVSALAAVRAGCRPQSRE